MHDDRLPGSPVETPPRCAPARPIGVPAPAAKTDAVPCERCGVEMFRMHAVWRCPGCGFKTDCCGW